jgi:predicted transposase YbfD/YdcC
MSREEKISKFIELFRSLPDERQEWKIKHKLVDIIFIAVVATIADCDDWEEIEWFARKKEGWLRKYIELPGGIPSHDTMERVFAWIDPELFRAAFLSWVAIATEGMSSVGGVLAVDGKVMRGTKDAGKKALDVVNAWCGEMGLILGQEFTREKSNEMKAIPKLLDVLDVAGRIVTVDAGGTYKEIAEKIISGKGDYVLALKGNQPNMLENAELFFDTELNCEGESEFEIKSVSSKEKGHGRIETRTYYMTERTEWLEKKDEWAGLRSIGMVRSRTENITTGAKTDETRYFISSLPCEASRFAYAVRRHWGVESMHWSLDMTFNEDGRRSRKNNSAKNLAQLNRLAYDIIKTGPVPKKRMPLKRLRKEALVDDTYLEQLVSAIF